MIDQFAIYRFTAPFRSRLQRRLRDERRGIDAQAFARALSTDDRQVEASHALWVMLRRQAFVPDFRPCPDDDLAKIYAMGPEEVRDDLIDPLLDMLGLDVSGLDVAGFDFAAITTPRQVIEFLVNVAEAQNR